jgi:hypothetical protein
VRLLRKAGQLGRDEAFAWQVAMTIAMFPPVFSVQFPVYERP